VPLTAELKLEVWDSPNSAGVVIDAVRCCKLALDRGLGGTLEGPSAYFMKSPPVQHSDERARQMVEEFIAAPGAPVPVGDGAALTSARGDDAAVEEAPRSAV
jgi:myo-inositol-1-phosphate synthase